MTLFVCSPDDQNCMIKDDNKDSVFCILYSVPYIIAYSCEEDDIMAAAAGISTPDRIKTLLSSFVDPAERPNNQDTRYVTFVM